MFPPKRLAVIALASLLTLVAQPGLVTAADAGGPVTVKVNMARILRISAPASTVIVGNPGVADVTIQDPQTLVLTGKSYGQTNLIVLDDQGNPIADTLLEVIQANTNTVTIFQGSSRTTVACSTTCQPTIMLGDDTNYSNSVIAGSTVIAGAAR
jgi:Flp pilus assembly secretin CpaC